MKRIITSLILLSVMIAISGCGNKVSNGTYENEIIVNEIENEKELTIEIEDGPVYGSCIFTESASIDEIKNYFESNGYTDSNMDTREFMAPMISVDESICEKSFYYGAKDGKKVIVCVKDVSSETGEYLYYAYVNSLKVDSSYQEEMIDSELSIYKSVDGNNVYFSWYTPDKKNFIYIGCEMSSFEEIKTHVRYLTGKEI